MNDISQNRYIKKSKGKNSRHNTINKLKQDQDIRKILETVIINKTEFELIQDNESNKVGYPLQTLKRPVSSILKQRHKVNGVLTKPQPKPQQHTVSIEYKCDEGDSYTYIPIQKSKPDLMISNNQFGLESNNESTSRQQTIPTLPFKNLLIESIESNPSLVNLTTSIDSKADHNNNINTTRNKTVEHIEINQAIVEKAVEKDLNMEKGYNYRQFHYNQPENNDKSIVNLTTSIDSKPDIISKHKSQAKPNLMKKTKLINKAQANTTPIPIQSAKDINSSSLSFRNKVSHQSSRKTPIRTFNERAFLIANSSHEAQPLKLQPTFLSNRNEAMKKQMKYVPLLKTGVFPNDGSCLLLKPLSKTIMNNINHIKYAKDCPCKDHTKVHTSKYDNNYTCDIHQSLNDSSMLRSHKNLQNKQGDLQSSTNTLNIGDNTNRQDTQKKSMTQRSMK